MGDKTGISWTDSTWNPATGCSLVSPGCRFCYAKTLSENLRDRGMRKYANGFDFTLQPQDLELQDRVMFREVSGGLGSLVEFGFGEFFILRFVAMRCGRLQNKTQLEILTISFSNWR